MFEGYGKLQGLWTEREVNQIVEHYNVLWLISFVSFFALVFTWAMSPRLTNW